MRATVTIVDEEVMGPLLSRRVVLGGSAALAILLAAGVDISAARPAAATAPPTSAAGVIALGRSYIGSTLPTLLPQTEAPWSGYGVHDWCMWFVSWCLRGLGHGYLTWASQLDFLPAHATPQVGDVAVFGSYHIGFVSQVSGGVRILDGNRTSTGSSAGTTKVNEGSNFDSPVYRRPAYSGTDPIATPKNGDNNMLLIYMAGTPFTFALFGPGFWYEWTATSGGDPVANAFAAQITGGTTIGGVPVNATQWAAIKAATGVA